jgi:hypothetical protein
MSSTISTDLKFISYGARNREWPEDHAADEGRAEHHEPLVVARAAANGAGQNADGKVRTLTALVYWKGIRRRQLGRFNFDVVENDRCQNHSRYSHDSLANDQCEQGKPDGIFD